MRTTMRAAFLATLLLAHASCGVRPQPPAISHISNADSIVRVQANSMGNPFIDDWPERQAILDTAERGCHLFGKYAVYLSNRCLLQTTGLFAACIRVEYLFACGTEKQYEAAAKTWAAKAWEKPAEERAEAEPEARPAPNPKSNALYKDCLKQFPSDWCSDWYLTDEVSVGHGN